MIRWRNGMVVEQLRSWPGAVELQVRLDARASDDPALVRALAYPDLVGTPNRGDRVLLNTNALALGLGTGGYALVVAMPDRLPADQPAQGHIVKGRYGPLQTVRLAADEEASPYRSALATAAGLEGMPVVVADLHSALPAILAGVRADDLAARVAYVMTDGGALPLGFSRTVAALAGHLAGTVTTGQSWGGDLEAVNLHSGLLAARFALGADLAIVTQGPGNLGTGSGWGFSGVNAGEAINATAALHGRPVASLRISGADPRPRHRGVSHHSLTAYGKVALAAADIVLPDAVSQEIRDAVQPLAVRHRIVTVPTGGLDAALRASPVPLSTMGRGLAADYDYFLAAAAAGRHAAHLILVDHEVNGRFDGVSRRKLHDRSGGVGWPDYG